MPEIILHRGARKYAPENTVPAFLKAYDFNPDGVEFDVQMTKDKKLVICHDYSINDTSNGKGKISDYTLEELMGFDFGSFFSDEYIGTRIPTLKEALEAAKNFKIINIEIKSPKYDDYSVVEKTIEEVENLQLTTKALISSFDEKVVKDVKAINKSIKTGLLYSPIEGGDRGRLEADLINYAKDIMVDALHPHLLCIREGYIKEAHSNGLTVNAWTVNNHIGMERLKIKKCDSIITDEPELANRILREKLQFHTNNF